MKARLFLAFLLLSLFHQAFSDEFDSLYVHSFSTNFTSKINLANRKFFFHIKPQIQPDSFSLNGIKYSPNLSWSFGAGGTYKNVQINLMFKLPGSDKNEGYYGKTSFTNIDLNIYTRKIALRAYFRNYKGFYMANPDKNIRFWSSRKTHPQRRDIEYRNAMLEGFYVFNNKKYSLHATYKQSERQKLNVGSWLLKAKMERYRVKAEEYLIPEYMQYYYKELKSLTGFKYNAFNISTGYTHSFIWKKYFYFIPIVFTGPSIINNKYELDTGAMVNNHLTFSSNIRLSSGYNGDFLFAGFIADWEGSLLNSKKVDIGATNMYIRFSAGLRF